MSLRDYQQRAIDELYSWLSANDGHPCLVLPTGSGKSHIIAALCKDALQNWPETRILMLTHQKELIEQNAEKLRSVWPNAPMGIYSASVGQKELGEPITFAGIQSIRTKAVQVGHVDLIVIDECFVAGTKIETPNGSIDIDKVRCGDTVINQCGFGTVEAISCKPTYETYVVELEDGRTIECTGNHPFFTSEGWRQAKNLANGSYVFGIQDMSSLWGSVQAMGEVQRGRKNNICHAGASMEQAKLLLSKVCEEIKSDSAKFSGSPKNQQSTERNSSQAYKAWRERAIASFTSIGATPCLGGWVDSRICNKDSCRSSQRHISECLQSGHCQCRNDDSHRIRRKIAFQSGKARARSEKSRIFSGSRVVRVSHIKRESPVPVFNLQVSGHPSYFVNGIAVHNCHLVSHKDEGSYRTFISELASINPAIRVIGLTATPWRLGHGLITDDPAIFEDLVEPVTIEELIARGFLSPLRSKVTDVKYDLTGIHKRGGEFIEQELAATLNTESYNDVVTAEIIRFGQDRKSWLVFCAGIDHAKEMARKLSDYTLSAYITGETPKSERQRILSDFKAGRIRALTNANVLTTGFDAPNIDLIAMLRPTMSPSLYVQMAGRGMRLSEGKENCLVLDFAGNVQRHGPITYVKTPSRSNGKGEGEAPTKSCEHCMELVHPSAKVCPACGEPFPEPERPELTLHNDDIMGLEAKEMPVTEWQWKKHTSRTSGLDMLMVTYFGQLSDRPVREYFPVKHIGYAGEKALREIGLIANKAGVSFKPNSDLEDWAHTLNAGFCPLSIKYRMDGKYHRVVNRYWDV